MMGDVVANKTILDNLKSDPPLKGKTIVIKYGGSVLDHRSQNVFQEIAQISSLGVQVVLVHGGGPQINQMLAKLNITPRHINGLRITDKETVDIAEMVLCGSISKSLVANLQRLGMNSLGLSGNDLGLFSVKNKKDAPVDLGYFGEVSRVNADHLNLLLRQSFIPVISPVGLNDAGETCILDADHLAASLAAALQAERLFILTNVPGVFKSMDDSNVMIDELSDMEADTMLNDGSISGGMIPKLRSCIDAVRAGVGSVHIFDGQLPGSLMQNATNNTIGTVIRLQKLNAGKEPVSV